MMLKYLGTSRGTTLRLSFERPLSRAELNVTETGQNPNDNILKDDYFALKRCQYPIDVLETHQTLRPLSMHARLLSKSQSCFICKCGTLPLN